MDAPKQVYREEAFELLSDLEDALTHGVGDIGERFPGRRRHLADHVHLSGRDQCLHRDTGFGIVGEQRVDACLVLDEKLLPVVVHARSLRHGGGGSSLRIGGLSGLDLPRRLDDRHSHRGLRRRDDRRTRRYGRLGSDACRSPSGEPGRGAAGSGGRTPTSDDRVVAGSACRCVNAAGRAARWEALHDAPWAAASSAAVAHHRRRADRSR